jgi:DNA-binding MarR family transcriptional regulator
VPVRREGFLLASCISGVATVSEAAFDELIHAPLRLQICAMLSPVRSLPFSDLRDRLEISDSVLSKHLSALAGAGYIEVSRVRANSRSRRQVTLTKPGRTALRAHLAALQAIAAAAEPAMAQEPSGARAAKRRRARREVALDPRIA